MGRATLSVVGKPDLSWLQVCGNITPADGTAWAFEDPCLTTWEARELGDRLREVAAGTEPPFRGYRESQGWLVSPSPTPVSPWRIGQLIVCGLGLISPLKRGRHGCTGDKDVIPTTTSCAWTYPLTR